MKLMPVPPSATMTVLIRPRVEQKSITSAQMMTSEMKCGIYVIVCTSFLKCAFFTSLSISARIIGAGKANTRP